MKKSLLLFRRKGFTLIECLIAIAVFGAMTMIVFMILTHARTQTVEANKSEEDLSNLIENVVGDETYKRYNDAHHAGGNDVLNLVVDGSSQPFTISYNVIDGNKNFVKCSDPNCGHYGNNTDFMIDASGNPIAKISFAQTDYICPKCGTAFVDTLTCEECATTGSHTDSTLFTYLPNTAGYMCNTCGGTAVHHDSYNAASTGDADLSVSGIVPNAIRYGEVKDRASTGRQASDLLYYNNTATGGGKIEFGLSYQASINGTVPGTYTLTVRGADVPADAVNASTGAYEMIIELPPHYAIKNLSAASGSATVSGFTNGDSSNNNATIHITTSTGNATSVSFQLVNYKSGFSFENDYMDTSDNNQTGLAGYWFGMTGVTVVRDSETSYVKSSSFSNKQVACRVIT